MPCGHLQLRYSVYRRIRAAVGGSTVAEEQEIEATVCQICETKCTPGLLSMLLSGQTSIPEFDPGDTKRLVCWKCAREIRPEDVSTICGQCTDTVCYNCMVLARAKRNSPFCPSCSQEIPITTTIERFAMKNENLKGCLPIDWGKGRVFDSSQGRKKCYACGNRFAISEFLAFGDHVNCWVCATCIGKKYIENQGKCHKCTLPYDQNNPELQKILVNREDSDRSSYRGKQAKTATPPIALSQKGTALGKTVGMTGEPQEVEEGKEPPRKAPAPPVEVEESKESPSRTVSVGNLCQICREVIPEAEAVRLEGDPCQVCVTCLMHSDEATRCPACNQSYCESDLRICQKKIATVSKFTCDKCKKQAPQQYKHQCGMKNLCAECGKKSLISKGLKGNICCEFCRQAGLCEELKINPTQDNYECCRCQRRMELLDVAHWCTDKQFWCFKCMGLNDKNRTARCPNCRVTLNNKYFALMSSGSYLP